MKHNATQFDLPEVGEAFNLTGETIAEPVKETQRKPDQDQPGLFAD